MQNYMHRASKSTLDYLHKGKGQLSCTLGVWDEENWESINMVTEWRGHQLNTVLEAENDKALISLQWNWTLPAKHPNTTLLDVGVNGHLVFRIKNRESQHLRYNIHEIVQNMWPSCQYSGAKVSWTQ